MPKPTDKELPVIRCSSLPRILTCHASLDSSAMQIVHDSSDVARIGNAVHELLAKYITNAPIDFDKILKKHKVSADDVSALYAVGKNLWHDIAGGLKVLMVEHMAIRDMGNGTVLRGTADVATEVIGADVPTILFVDWKSGAVKDCIDQLTGYGWHAKQEWPEVEKILVIPAFLRAYPDYEIIEISMDKINALPDRIADAMSRPNVFSPSPDRCQYCPRNATCPAKQAIVQSAVTDLAEIGSQTALTPQGLAALWDKYNLLKKAMEGYHDTLKGVLIAEGSIDMGNGKEMTLVDTAKEKINPVEAWPIICEDLSLEELLPLISIPKGKVSGLIGDKKEYKTKKESIAQFIKRLKKAGAIKTTVSRSITVRDVQEKEA